LRKCPPAHSIYYPNAQPEYCQKIGVFRPKILNQLHSQCMATENFDLLSKVTLTNRALTKKKAHHEIPKWLGPPGLNLSRIH